MLRRFLADLRACYSAKNIAWQLLAVVLTYALVMSRFDWWWFTHTRGATLQSWLFPAAILGGLLPILLPIFLFIGREKVAAFASAKAAFLGFLISSFYKVWTGRVPPDFHATALVDISRQFQFGFLRGGAFWGWPSSHTTVAFAVAVALFIIYRHKPFVRYAALAVALYIGIGVSTNIHWFSEFVAGAIIGSVIGSIVGRNYRRKVSPYAPVR